MARVAIGFDERFAHDGAIRAVLGPDLEAGEQHQNDDDDAHGDAQDTKAELGRPGPEPTLRRTW